MLTMKLFMMGILTGAASTKAGTDSWSLSNFLKNSFKTLGDWFSLAVSILGICAVAWAVWQIVSGLMSHGKKQVNWAIAIVLLIVGGALSVSGGFGFVQDIAGSGQTTIKELGGQK